MKAGWTKRTLNFTQPAGTSRGVMKTRDIWIITLIDKEKTGIGECAPLPGLSLDNIDQIESKLGEVCKNPHLYINDLSILKEFPSIRFGLEMAELDLRNGGNQNYYGSIEPIKINGLIWMGNLDFMMHQVEQKLTEGWKCIKMKIGALEFDKELDILQSIRSQFRKDNLELRVDANGAFTVSDTNEKLNRLAEFELHSIEQPIQTGQWDLLTELCQYSPIPIALDEELIPLVNEKDRIEMLDRVKPQYLVLKPSLLGGFSESEKWIELAKERNISWWITSALESNIGLNAIAQWSGKMQPNGFQGLGTGQLFTNNIPSPLTVKSGKLSIDQSKIWDDVNQFIADWFSSSDEMVLQTSGSTGEPKSIKVKKEWMKNSAQLTGKTFELMEGDSTLLCMPMKYVAGKMTVVRALELELDLKVIEPCSNPLKNINKPINFAAMVPLQLENSLNDLDKIKTLIVGGGQVNSKLVEKLQNVSTQVYETYGMTETLTHVAIKPLNGPSKSDVFRALDDIHFELDARECLVIHATALNPEPIVTNDLVDLIDENSFRWLGRYDNVINSGGIKIIPEVVEAKLSSIVPNRRFFIAGKSDKSLGEKVVLVVEGKSMDISCKSLDKFEQPKEIHFIPEFVETKSGKIHRQTTLSLI
jgi:o-succinylbenzoate synthase